MHIEEKVAMRILAGARRWLNANGLERRYLTDEERQRRVAEYTRQVTSHGCIVAWLPPPDQRGLKWRRMPVKLQQWRGFAY
ncbi:MAG: hypothetical protein MUP47_09480 [Phycisphaerae bacterium]|nr:hypothetical protein [Phycisphaerae bacterium]